jgi:hypothetical protein
MGKQYPQRPKAHQLEEMSERYFRTNLPRNWTCQRVQNDYGVDVQVGIVDDELVEGLELLVQLKASAMPSRAQTETVSLKVSTYNHLWDRLQVVMLTKFVEADNEAYWLLLKDVPFPPQEQKTFTIEIPKTNRISDIDWNAIVEYIRDVHDTKLESRRKHLRKPSP